MSFRLFPRRVPTNGQWLIAAHGGDRGPDSPPVRIPDISLAGGGLADGLRRSRRTLPALGPLFGAVHPAP